MIDRSTRRCSSTAWEFIATSVSPSRAPSTSRAAKTSTAVGAMPRIGSHSDIAADVVIVIVRLPRRSTSQPLNRLDASPPRPIPTSVRPSAASEMPSSACSSGSRGVHDDNVAPLTKNTAPIAAAATRARRRRRRWPALGGDQRDRTRRRRTSRRSPVCSSTTSGRDLGAGLAVLRARPAVRPRRPQPVAAPAPHRRQHVPERAALVGEAVLVAHRRLSWYATRSSIPSSHSRLSRAVSTARGTPSDDWNSSNRRRP